MSRWPYEETETAHFLLRLIDVTLSSAANHQAVDAWLGWELLAHKKQPINDKP